MKEEKSNCLESCSCMEGNDEKNDLPKQGMMKCMKGARWFLLIPGALITLAFLLGYFLEPATLRMLWLVITGTLLTIGAIFYIIMNIWTNKLQRKPVN